MLIDFVMTPQENINAPKANVISPSDKVNKPFAGGALYSVEMKMIEDLGLMYPTTTSKKKTRYAIYECPYCGKRFKTQCGPVNRGRTISCGCEWKRRFFA